MKKIIKVLSIILFSMIILFTCKGKVEAKSYEIQDMDIQAIINQDGSVSIEQKLTYKFNGEYNGIFINIPYNMESKSILKSNKINDSFYNGDNIVVNKVELINGTEEQEFKQVNTAFNGYSNVYTNIKKNGIQEIKIYSPSINTTKTFKVNYIIENLCVKHNDIGELYYNFIGGDWEVEIKKLNIDIYIPSNTEEIRIWGHGPYNGQSKIINNTHCNFKVNNVKAGQYVAARVLFNNSNIPNAQKLSGIDAKELVYKDENLIAGNKEKKDSFTWKIIIFAICLLIYWIILMSIFENDKKYPVSNIKEEELFEKYNPMLAGCIQGSRTILARDIIAVILELINKQIINLENKPSMEKENYSYIITKNKELEDKMDNIERYVYNWVFDSNDSVVLTDRLKEMPKEKDSYIKFKALDNLVQSTLNQKGANQAKVPLCIRVFNIFLFIISIVVIYKHIMLNGINLYKSEINFETLILYIIYIFPLIPFLIGILYIPINLIIIIKHKLNKTVQKITGQKIVTKIIGLLILFGIIITLTAIFVKERYLIADEILICIATIIIVTDNLMLKNNSIMIQDYSRLNALKNKIQDYSLMNDKDIEHIVLWEQYLSYAVSFGIANRIIKRAGLLNIDESAELLNNSIFTNFIISDYSMFYEFASLDKRFIRQYKQTTGKMLRGFANSSSSRRRTEDFLEEADSLVAEVAAGGGGAF